MVSLGCATVLDCTWSLMLLQCCIRDCTSQHQGVFKTREHRDQDKTKTAHILNIHQMYIFCYELKKLCLTCANNKYTLLGDHYNSFLLVICGGSGHDETIPQPLSWRSFCTSAVFGLDPTEIFTSHLRSVSVATGEPEPVGSGSCRWLTDGEVAH